MDKEAFLGWLVQVLRQYILPAHVPLTHCVRVMQAIRRIMGTIEEELYPK